MTQWNIDLTLSTVSAISAQACSRQALLISEPPSSIYPSLCRLVEMVIKRHRKRLDGHFHMFITALQSLLRLLLCRPPRDPATAAAKGQAAITTTVSHLSRWESHAKRFARLLTLICEPTVATVTRGGGPLDSEKDRAKRYVGQYMHLVLAQYVRLQLESGSVPVPRGVRAALEPGVYAILDVTSQDGLRVVNDGMDAGGRVVFKELYRQWQRFGKWTGV
jgi:nucleolar pre-ribosomal-associated protein 2